MYVIRMIDEKNQKSLIIQAVGFVLTSPDEVSFSWQNKSTKLIVAIIYRIHHLNFFRKSKKMQRF